MTEAQIALARRAVAAPGWRWMRGMRIAAPTEVEVLVLALEVAP